MYFSTVSEWLDWINKIHNLQIVLGLDRVKKVASALNVLSPACPVIIVGGTNGKGSTVAGLEAIYQTAGYRVGTFTSPILFKHNEEVRINGECATDTSFCDAFAKVEAARGDVLLTSFEFHTLAALYILEKAKLDVMILEVGLGGRLDAVNIIDADVAIVTSIGIDHVEWLGKTREKIAYEKAGIFRNGKPAICGDLSPPDSLITCAKTIHAPLFCNGCDFIFHINQKSWDWKYSSQHIVYENLPFSQLALENMASVLMAVTLLQNHLPVKREAIDKGLAMVSLPGRIQIIRASDSQPITKIFDVSHNPEAITFLAKKLKTFLLEENDHTTSNKTYAVFSMLADKDVLESIRAIYHQIDEWYIAPLNTPRAANQQQLTHAFQLLSIRAVNNFSSIKKAYEAVMKKATRGDIIIIFGSFHTVAEVLAT